MMRGLVIHNTNTPELPLHLNIGINAGEAHSRGRRSVRNTRAIGGPGLRFCRNRSDRGIEIGEGFVCRQGPEI